MRPETSFEMYHRDLSIEGSQGRSGRRRGVALDNDGVWRDCLENRIEPSMPRLLMLS